MDKENPTLELLQPAPEEQLLRWLAEFYGKPVTIVRRAVLRHRDLSFVERLWVDNALPASLIYKLVLPPWDVEQDLHERVLIPSISNSATLFMTGHHGPLTALFMEDLGECSLLNSPSTAELAASVGTELAKMHRAYSYRIDELMAVNVLRSLLPLDYEAFTTAMIEKLHCWNLITASQMQQLLAVAAVLAMKLAGEPVSLVHGDLYAENILVRGEHLYIIDWSWFTMVGLPAMDLAALTSNHFKNGDFYHWHDIVIDSYCFESGRQSDDVRKVLPYAEVLSRLLFLNWLVVRRERGIMGTTVGSVDALIPDVIEELIARISAVS